MQLYIDEEDKKDDGRGHENLNNMIRRGKKILLMSGLSFSAISKHTRKRGKNGRTFKIFNNIKIYCEA